MARIKFFEIDDFLAEADHAALLDFALKHEAEFLPSQVRVGSQGHYDPAVRRSMLCQASLGQLGERFEAAVLALLDELLSGTGTPAFALSRCEVELAAHRDGCFFAAHQDTLSQADRVGVKSDRVISLVYYFHALPKRFSGGELAIHPFGREPPVLIEPRHNRLVAFPAFALHEVCPIVCPGDGFADARFSINCWLHRVRPQ